MANFNRKRDKIAVHQKKMNFSKLSTYALKCFETLMVRFVRVLAIAF